MPRHALKNLKILRSWAQENTRKTSLAKQKRHDRPGKENVCDFLL
jgi:hypothetical protein